MSNPVVEDIKEGLKLLSQAIVGLFFMLGGAAWFAYELMQKPVHTGHLIAAGSVCVFGAAVLPSVGPVVMASLKGVAGVVQSFLPAKQPPSAP